MIHIESLFNMNYSNFKDQISRSNRNLKRIKNQENPGGPEKDVKVFCNHASKILSSKTKLKNYHQKLSSKGFLQSREQIIIEKSSYIIYAYARESFEPY